VCKLKKTLDGLGQSPRVWFDRLSQALQICVYKQNQADHTLFFKHSYQGKVTDVIVYVDDIILIGNDDEEIIEIKNLSCQ
jgi:hypothetical protein